MRHYKINNGKNMGSNTYTSDIKIVEKEVKTYQPKKIFNTKSTERFEDARILGGNPNGIFNFNRTPHKWAKELYDKMRGRTWFPGQMKLSDDVVKYAKLSPEVKRCYDLVLAQLITNDSIQTNQLMDKINSYITSPIVNAALSVQATEESVHSESYALMAEDICKDTDRIYNMHHEDEELALKNESVQHLYSCIYDTEANGKELKLEDILMAFVANQILEELVFPGGFVTLLSLEKDMPNSAEIIKEIMKDETLSHVQLFKFIFRTAIQEECGGIIPVKLENRALELISYMTVAEKRWTKYVTKGLLGFSDKAIDVFVESKANSVCKNLMLKQLFEKVDNNPLDKILTDRLKGGLHESRTNFFECNATEYTKNGVIDDY